MIVHMSVSGKALNQLKYLANAKGILTSKLIAQILYEKLELAVWEYAECQWSGPADVFESPFLHFTIYLGNAAENSLIQRASRSLKPSGEPLSELEYLHHIFSTRLQAEAHEEIKLTYPLLPHYARLH